MRTSILVGFALILLFGCETAAVLRYTPSFNYSPPKQANPGATDVTFAVIDASNPPAFPLFQQLAQSLSRDLLAILTARGYTMRGPFRTFDDMTFPDKKGSDLILIPELKIQADDSGIAWSPIYGGVFQGKGILIITGSVNLVVEESLSGEKMWVKNFDIPRATIPVETIYGYPGRTSVQVLLEKEGQIYNDIAKALEAQYKPILERTYQYLDPEEMQIVKTQSQEIRSKKVY